jgi:ribosomal protein L37E
MYCSICQDDDHTAPDCDYYRPPGHDLPTAEADQPGRLPQHRACSRCGTLTYTWDRQPCGHHEIPGTERPYVGTAPIRQPPRDHAALALQQVAEARAARGDDLDQWWAKVTAGRSVPLSPPQPHTQ